MQANGDEGFDRVVGADEAGLTDEQLARRSRKPKP